MVFAVRVTGTLGKPEYEVMVPLLDEKIAQHGKLNLYWEMTGLDHWLAGGLWEDLKFDLKHLNSFLKIAIVGDRAWEKALTTLMKPFTTAQVKYFEHHHRDAAREWVGL
ncbi:hypothetical protein TH63_04760 [Rufibacter radiotolerans]|uniref:SpoIIAA-like protein n=2 Tax=Rufibacter radiotolerans TaxID=1379910 RepID=A0A0H4VQ88_9BACT|nr:hypothetical protein TH63_04760 [Rufibacter radiotolerans]